MVNQVIVQLTTHFLFCLLLFASAKRGTYVPVVKFDEFHECSNSSINRILNITMGMIGRGKYVINLVYQIAKTIEGGKVWFTVKKCETSSANDCEHFMKFGMDLCGVFSDETQPWSSFLKNMQPRLKCPVKPGIYRLVNASLDGTESLRTNNVATGKWIQDYHWRVKFNFLDHKESLGCGIIVISYQKIRV